MICSLTQKTCTGGFFVTRCTIISSVISEKCQFSRQFRPECYLKISQTSMFGIILILEELPKQLRTKSLIHKPTYTALFTKYKLHYLCLFLMTYTSASSREETCVYKWTLCFTIADTKLFKIRSNSSGHSVRKKINKLAQFARYYIPSQTI